MILGHAVVDANAVVKGSFGIGGNAHISGYVFRSVISGDAYVAERERVIGRKIETPEKAAQGIMNQEPKRLAFLDVLAPDSNNTGGGKKNDRIYENY